MKALDQPGVSCSLHPFTLPQATTSPPNSTLINMPFWHQNRSPVERRHRLRAPAFQVDFRQSSPTAASPESQTSTEKRRSKLKPLDFWDKPLPTYKIVYARPQLSMSEEDPFWITTEPVHKASTEDDNSQSATTIESLQPLQSPTTIDYKRHST